MANPWRTTQQPAPRTATPSQVLDYTISQFKDNQPNWARALVDQSVSLTPEDYSAITGETFRNAIRNLFDVPSNWGQTSAQDTSFAGLGRTEAARTESFYNTTVANMSDSLKNEYMKRLTDFATNSGGEAFSNQSGFRTHLEQIKKSKKLVNTQSPKDIQRTNTIKSLLSGESQQSLLGG